MRRLFALIFAASGAAALIYEVTWTRLLTLQLGHSVAAASTVLAAFMGGLAAGSALGGRFGVALSPTRALRLYAGLEVAIAVLALLLPYELRLLNPLLQFAYADGAGGTLFGMLRMLASLVLLALPAAAMGATFPIASRWFVQHVGLAARDAGVLYAANTVGAAAGALAAGFLLLPSLGLMETTWVGVGLNFVAAAGAWQLARVSVALDPASEPMAADDAVQRESSAPKQTAESSTATHRESRDSRHQRRRRHATRASETSKTRALVAPITVAAAVLAMSGFASLVLQVVWTRILALLLGPTTYAFSTMVAVFIAGIAVGAAMASRIVSRLRQPVTALAISLALAVGSAAVATTRVDGALLQIAATVASPDTTFTALLIQQALLAIALLGPMTVAFGAAFPFAVAAAGAGNTRLTADLGYIYALNTVGAIAGALIGGFLLIPWLGLHGAVRVVTILGALGAAAAIVAGAVRGMERWIGLAVAAVVLALGVTLPEWDRLLLSSGGYKYAAALAGPDLRTSLTAGDLLYYREGPSGTVAVRKVGGTTSLAIDGKVDASNSGDMLTQRLLAHVPLLLHSNPKRVAILGLGSGVTLGSALRHPIDRADVLEISPQVVEAAAFFNAENHNALADPRTRMILGDGRTHLLFTRERYDAIISEPSNPWMAGIAALFTREFFAAARDRLAPGGVLCQWAHTYDISTRDLQSIVATFLSVFPDGTLWLVGDGDVLLIGSNAPIGPQLDQITQRWQRPGVAADLASVGVQVPRHLLSLYVSQGAALATWAGDAPAQTDDRAALEFSGPENALGRTSDDNAALLRALAEQGNQTPPAVERARTGATPREIRDRGWMLFQADAVRPAYDDFLKAAEADPDDERALEGLIRASAPLRRTSHAREVLGRLASDPTHQAAKLALARLLAAEGQFDAALEIPLRIVQFDPENVAALEVMASILSDVGDAERMKPVVAKLREQAPSSEAAHYYSAALLFMEERTYLALGEARRVLTINPNHAKAHNLVGACLASLGQRDEARIAFQASLAANPRDPATYANLATLELQSGDRARARKYYVEALTIDPTSSVARRGLADLSPHPN